MSPALSTTPSVFITHHDPAHWPSLLVAPYLCPDFLVLLFLGLGLSYWELRRRSLASSESIVWTLARTPLVGFAAASALGIVASTLLVCFAPRYMAQAVPLIYLMVGFGLFGDGKRQAWKLAILACIVAMNLANRSGRWYSNIDEGPGSAHSEPEKARERSYEFERYHDANVEAARRLEGEFSDQPMIVAAPFGHILGEPKFGYVSRPLNIACAGMRREVFPFVPNPEEAKLKDPIYVRDRYADPTTIAPLEPGDELILDDGLVPPLLIYRKRWQGSVPTRPEEIESWYRTRGWVGATLLDCIRHRLSSLRSVGRSAQGEDEIRGLIAALPKFMELRVLSIGMKISERKNREAERELEAASALFPKEAWFAGSLGRLRLSENRVADAVGPIETSAQLAPSAPEIVAGLAELRDRQGRSAEATSLYRSIVATTADPLVLLRFGDLLTRQGMAGEALPYLEKGARLSGNVPTSQRLLAAALLALGRPAEALPRLEAAAQANPNDSDALFSLAYARYRLGGAEDALPVLRSLTKDATKGTQAQNLLAWILATHPDEKLRDGATAFQLAEGIWKTQGGKDPTVLDTLAAAHAECGRFVEAASVQLRCLQLLERTAAPDRIAQTRARLDLYRANQPYRELPRR